MSENEERTLRPQILFSIQRQKKEREFDPDRLEELGIGFHCTDCGWRGTSAPMNDIEEDLEVVCVECGAKAVKNMLSENISEISEVFEQIVGEEQLFVPYSELQDAVSMTTYAFDEALTYLATREDSEVVFKDGKTLIHIKEREPKENETNEI